MAIINRNIINPHTRDDSIIWLMVASPVLPGLMIFDKQPGIASILVFFAPIIIFFLCLLYRLSANKKLKMKCLEDAEKCFKAFAGFGFDHCDVAIYDDGPQKKVTALRALK